MAEQTSLHEKCQALQERADEVHVEERCCWVALERSFAES
jgi:hypothetical protein